MNKEREIKQRKENRLNQNHKSTISNSKKKKEFKKVKIIKQKEQIRLRFINFLFLIRKKNTKKKKIKFKKY